MKYLKVIILVIFAFGCESKDSKKNEREISELIDSAVKENKNSFQLEGLSFNWDSLMVIPPYTVVRKVKSLADADLKVLEKTQIEFRDDICVLAFFQEGRIISYAEMKRNYDFSELSGKSYSRSSVFQFVRDPLTKSARYLIKDK